MRPTEVLKEALQEWLRTKFEQYKVTAPVKNATPEEAFVMAWGALGKSIEAVNSMRTLPVHEQLEWFALAMLVDCNPKHIYVVKQQHPEMVVVNIVLDVAGGD
jgi:hypothetical protein